MILIQKKETPAHIWNAAQKVQQSDNWVSYTSRDCFEELCKICGGKNVIRQALLEEQRYLCAYCMRRIENIEDAADDKFTKIEHYVPCSVDKDKSVDFQNFFAVCTGGSKPKWARLGISEDDNIIECCEAVRPEREELKIDPRNKEMMKYIVYASNGRIDFAPPADYDAETAQKIKENINKDLLLNGILKGEEGKEQVVADTTTRLLYNRRGSYQAIWRNLDRLYRQGKLTIKVIERRIEEINNQEKMEPFAGVKLFVLHKAYNHLLCIDRNRT